MPPFIDSPSLSLFLIRTFNPVPQPFDPARTAFLNRTSPLLLKENKANEERGRIDAHFSHNLLSTRKEKERKADIL